jgi:hypothetical protein
MDTDEMDLLEQELLDEVDRRLDYPEHVAVTCRWVDDESVLGIITPTTADAPGKTFVLTYRDEDGDIAHEWADEIAALMFMRYIFEYAAWSKPSHGAVSSELSEFFARCADDVAAEIYFARWLLLPKDVSDGGICPVDPEMAELLVEALIRQSEISDANARLMRVAVQGEPIGDRDPNQLGLF